LNELTKEIVMRRRFWIFLFSAALLTAPAWAETPEEHLSIKNHVFVPQELTVPANQKLKLIVKNEDPTSAEFESHELNREKVVPANGEITVYLDPLGPGTYPFFDDFHRDTTTGKITAK
jgi:heme/copper-type cytochrome/quinol oxidase subunit 2